MASLYFMPLSWACTGALFYGFIRFVRGIRLRGSGQLFALVLGAPLIAGVSLLLVLLAQFVVALVGLAQSDLPLNVLIVGLLIALPIAFAIREPRGKSETG